MAPSARELPTESGEGERVKINLFKKYKLRELLPSPTAPPSSRRKAFWILRSAQNDEKRSTTKNAKCKTNFQLLFGVILRVAKDLDETRISKEFPYQITPVACMESATCCGMESAHSAVWNQHKVLYGITLPACIE